MDIGCQVPDSHVDERLRARVVTWLGAGAMEGGRLNVAPKMEMGTLVLDGTAEPGDYLTGCDSEGASCFLPIFNKTYIFENPKVKGSCL